MTLLINNHQGQSGELNNIKNIWISKGAIMTYTLDLVQNFKQNKFKKCLELIKLINGSSDIIEEFSLENCKIVCESLMINEENDFDKIHDIQEQHYLFLEKVTSVEAFSESLPIQLKLIAMFNFTFWLVFYNNIELDLFEAEEYLELVNKELVIVLGRQVASVKTCSVPEKILSNLTCFENLILAEDYKTTLLIVELIVVILMFVVNVKRVLVKDSLEVVSFIINVLKHKINLATSAEEFSQMNSVKLPLYKFSICRTAILLSDIDSEVIDCLHLLESVFLLLLKDFRESLKSLQKDVNSDVKSLWNYLVVLNSFETENWNMCLGFLIKTPEVIQKDLKARFHIMQGKLNSIQKNHKEALKEFLRASALSPTCPTFYYYIGQEFARIGLIDLMVENFEKLVQALSLQVLEKDFHSNFETTLLEWIHPTDEITETEAYYALAVSHILNESFKSAAENFEKVLQSLDGQISDKKRIVEMPDFLIVLHEAAVTNLLLGNLIRAEQIALDAVGRYLPRKSLEIRKQQSTLSCKDSKWLQRTIQQELLEMDFDSNKLLNEMAYSEDLIYFFSENVVALLILSEVQRIQELEDYKTTLSNVFSIFSKYLALMHKKDKIDADEKHALTLAKALAGKTCVKIADVLTKQGEIPCVEKMFKRALSCNKGDREALYKYYQFLMKTGKAKEGLKLWNTFFKEKGIIEIDSVQTFSLRYFLIDKISKRELESIQQEIDFKNDKLF